MAVLRSSFTWTFDLELLIVKYDMLETIKHLINISPDISFTEYYQQYVMEVQDRSLDVEVNRLKNTDILSLDRLLSKLNKELITPYSGEL